MSYLDDFKMVSTSKGNNAVQYNLELLQQGWDSYYARTPDRVTGTIDGEESEFVIQNIKYGENFNDEKILLAENDVVIRIGSLVGWDGKTWLVNNEENRAITTHQAFKIQLCNNVLNWKDSNGVIKSAPCIFFETGLGYSDSDQEVKQTVTRREIHIQYNTDTNAIYENQRFIFGHKRSYVVTDVDDQTRPERLIVLRIEKDLPRPEDDLANNIAYNGINTPVQPMVNGVVFSEPFLTISKGQTKTISVYEYVNSVQQATAFTFRIDNVLGSYYSIVSSTANSITIKGLLYYKEGSLVAIKPSLAETSIPITFKSLI